MAATIKANPNPVNFPWPRVLGVGVSKMDTTITWDTDRDGLQGEVFVTRDGGVTEEKIAGGQGGGNRRGSVLAPIALGETLEFRLRRADNKNLLTSVTVTTQEVPGPQLLGGIDLSVWPPSQGIYRLWVSPGVDSVTISFRTRQSTNPFVEIFNTDTGKLAGLWARPEKKQSHSMDFAGFGNQPMAQNAEHTYRIVAPPAPGSPDPAIAEQKGTFRTGSRTATFFFDKITVRNDGDPNSPGEFRFSFGAGDADTGEPLGNVEFYGEASITDGHTEDVNKIVTIPTAPRLLWAQVVANEDDSSIFTFSGIATSGMKPSFTPPESSATEYEDYVHAYVTKHFDIGETLNGTLETPFEMSTGNFVIAYDVKGRRKVEASRGRWLSPGPLWIGVLGSMRVLSTDGSGSSVGPGQSAMVTGLEGLTHRVVLSPDGAVYHQVLSDYRQASRNSSWTNLGGRFLGPLTAVAAGPDRVGLFGLSPEGAVLYKTYSPGDHPDDDWRTLGGEFAGPVVAAVGAEEGIELFATSEDGAVFHRALADPQGEQHRGEWDYIGEGIVGSLTALSSSRSGLSLFALGHGGEVLHKRRPPQEEWRRAEWESLGVDSDGTLSAQWVADQSLLLVVTAEDETVRFLAWPHYPEEPPREGWQIAGTVNSLLQGQIPEGEALTVLDRAEGASDLRENGAE
jgi:hypothetical protein